MEEYKEIEKEIMGVKVKGKVSSEDKTITIDDPASVQALKEAFLMQERKNEVLRQMIMASVVALGLIAGIMCVMDLL